MGFFKSGRGGSVKGRVYRQDTCPTCGAQIGRNAMHAHQKKHERTSAATPKVTATEIRQEAPLASYDRPSVEDRPELYECVDCSQKSGAPTLCDRCLAARAAAGAAWCGPHPRPFNGLSAYDVRVLERMQRGESGTSFDGECFSLAEHFLDDTNRDTKEHATLLAITIQRAIEDWCEEHEIK